jgi:TonB family protein
MPISRVSRSWITRCLLHIAPSPCLLPQLHRCSLHLIVPSRSTTSRAAIVAAVAAIHVALLYLLITSGLRRTVVPIAPRIEVTLIHRLKPPIWRVSRLKLRPQLAKLQITLPLEPFDFKVKEPIELVRSQQPGVIGSPAPRGATVEPGGRVALTFTHFVVPNYPANVPPARDRRTATVALAVSTGGTVVAAKVVRSTGSAELDRAAVTAVRQWQFVPFAGPASGGALALVDIHFSPPSGIPDMPSAVVMPYSAVAAQIDAELQLQHPKHPPRSAALIWRLINELVTAFARDRGGHAGSALPSTEYAVERVLGPLGAPQSVRFVGIVPHGMDGAEPDPVERWNRPLLEPLRWEVYDVEQRQGFSVWLVRTDPLGKILRIEMTVRCKGTPCRKSWPPSAPSEDVDPTAPIHVARH